MWVLIMVEQRTLEQELNRVVYEVVQKGPYPSPTPTLEEQIRLKRQAIWELQNGQSPRPAPKTAFLAVVEELKDQLAELIVQNDQISQANAAARKVVDDTYQADLAAARLNPINIGTALCACIDWQLTSTVWFTLKDSGLSVAQQAKADQWRSDIMTIPFTYTVIAEAVEQYNQLLVTKPDYSLKWSQVPVAAFSGTPLSGVIPLVVKFTDSSLYDPAEWAWDLGDGLATTKNPEHTYNEAGTYTVKLTVTNPAGSDSMTKTEYVRAFISPTPPG